ADIREASILSVEVAQTGLGGDDALESTDQRAVFLAHGRSSRDREIGLDGIPRHGAAASDGGSASRRTSRGWGPAVRGELLKRGAAGRRGAGAPPSEASF